MSASVISSSYYSRLEALKNKADILNSRISDAQNRPAREDFYVTQLKKQRLMVNEEIEVMNRRVGV